MQYGQIKKLFCLLDLLLLRANMITPNCALCNKEITVENDTKEHLIPNAIGGRKKVKGFICKYCNNKYGADWESELAKQLNPLCLFFGIRRERGKVPPKLVETTGGDKFILNSDGRMDIEKPLYLETPLESSTEVRIQIKARSMSEAKGMLQGVKGKYPQIDLNAILKDLRHESSYCNDMVILNLPFGGHASGRSIVKSVLALAVSSGISAEICANAINYLKNEESEACFGYFYEYDLIKNRPIGIPLHCISIKGCSKTKRVLGYLEYFGFRRAVFCLSDNYEGEDLSNTYAINPITGEELNLVIELSLSNEQIREAYDYKKVPDGSVEAAFDKVMDVGMKAAFANEQDRVITEAVNYAFENCGAKEGDRLTQEQINKVNELFMAKMEPFILHLLHKSQI